MQKNSETSIGVADTDGKHVKIHWKFKVFELFDIFVTPLEHLWDMAAVGPCGGSGVTLLTT